MRKSFFGDRPEPEVGTTRGLVGDRLTVFCGSGTTGVGGVSFGLSKGLAFSVLPSSTLIPERWALDGKGTTGDFGAIEESSGPFSGSFWSSTPLGSCPFLSDLRSSSIVRIDDLNGVLGAWAAGAGAGVVFDDKDDIGGTAGFGGIAGGRGLVGLGAINNGLAVGGGGKGAGFVVVGNGNGETGLGATEITGADTGDLNTGGSEDVAGDTGVNGFGGSDGDWSLGGNGEGGGGGITATGFVPIPPKFEFGWWGIEEAVGIFDGTELGVEVGERGLADLGSVSEETGVVLSSMTNILNEASGEARDDELLEYWSRHFL